MNFETVGIGHPLVDIYFQSDDDILKECNLARGKFHHVDEEAFQRIRNLADTHGRMLKMEPGGSVSNTLWGLKLLGCEVAEFGKLGRDSNGAYLRKELKKNGIGDFLSEHNSSTGTEKALPTGTVLCLITSDSERTFAVYRGAAEKLGREDVNVEIICNSRILYLTGFEFESPGIQKAVIDMAGTLQAAGVLIAFDLADPGVVEYNFESMEIFVADNVDIIFANEKEAEVFTGKGAEDAVESLGDLCQYAIVKTGEKGSLIRTANRTYRIAARKAEALDTTGAGDMYAAGILYGILNKLGMEEAGRIASLSAAKVVEKIGARLSKQSIMNDQVLKYVQGVLKR